MKTPLNPLASVATLTVAALALTAPAWAAGNSSVGAVYTQTNSPSGNAVLAFARGADGSLTAAGTYPTGGMGTGASLGSQGAVTLSRDGNQLFVVNGGSNSVSAFRVRPDGLDLAGTFPSGGDRPISVCVRKGLAYVLNAGGVPNISGFIALGDGWMPIPGSTRALSPGAAGPAQVGFNPSGDFLLVTEKASNTIDAFPIGAGGLAGIPVTSPSVGSTPFGFDFDDRGYLLVSDAGNAASSYSVAADGHLTPITAPVPTNQAAPCWLVASKNSKFAYTANAGGGTISGFDVDRNGGLTLLDASGASATLGGGSHPLDEAVSVNGQFLYVLTDGFHSVTGYAIGTDGSLTPAGSVGGLPVGALGLAAR